MTPGARFIAAIPDGWRAGMLADCGSRGQVRITDVHLFAENYLAARVFGATRPVPVLDDPATLGAAIAVLREVGNTPSLVIVSEWVWNGRRWVAQRSARGVQRMRTDGTWHSNSGILSGSTEPEAIAAAAEALAGRAK